MTFTTWNPSDLSNLTLSGGNLTATGSSLSAYGVRSTDVLGSGKYYWEYTLGTLTQTQTNVGLASAGVPLNYVNLGSGTPCGVYVVKGGGIYTMNYTSESVSTGYSLAALSAGNVVGIAVDTVNQLVWFRVAPSGNWNGSGTANPATGVGGIPLPGGPAYKMCALFGGYFSTDVVTANFGASGFTGSVPSGFTSGFTTGASSGHSGMVTQAGLEEWTGGSNIRAQITQVGLEAWISVASVNVQGVVTQVVLEEWASVSGVVIGGGAPTKAASLMMGV